jgi:hypothetical protein
MCWFSTKETPKKIKENYPELNLEKTWKSWIINPILLCNNKNKQEMYLLENIKKGADFTYIIEDRGKL